jgi:hypothetical protein
MEGSCPGCGHTFTVLERSVAGPSTGPGEETPTGAEAGAAEPQGWAGPRMTCDSCDGVLSFRSAGVGLQAVCSGCGKVSVYVPRAEGAPERLGRRESMRPPERETRGGFGPSRARPCRECGGPLRFTTEDDGTITGECASCGNRFTLPPRRDGPGGPRGAPRGRFGSRPPGRFDRGPPRRPYGAARPGRDRFPRRDRRDGDDAEADDDRPRRRPRRP